MRGYVPPWSFGAVLAVLGAGTVIGVGVAVVGHRLFLIPFVIVAALAVGILYIVWSYFGSPAEPAPESPDADEPFQDPVEEADRLESTAAVADPSTTPPVSPAESVPDDPSYDPVEEADRLDSAATPPEPPASRGPDPK